MSTFLLNVHFLEPKFWRRNCSTILEMNLCMKYCSMSSPPNVCLSFIRCNFICIQIRFATIFSNAVILKIFCLRAPPNLAPALVEAYQHRKKLNTHYTVLVQSYCQDTQESDCERVNSSNCCVHAQQLPNAKHCNCQMPSITVLYERNDILVNLLIKF